MVHCVDYEKLDKWVSELVSMVRATYRCISLSFLYLHRRVDFTRRHTIILYRPKGQSTLDSLPLGTCIPSARELDASSSVNGGGGGGGGGDDVGTRKGSK